MKRKTIDSKLDKIYDKIDEMFKDTNFGLCDLTLETLNLSLLSTDEMLGYLTATLPASSKLNYRKTFFESVEQELKSRKEYYPELLSGLESK